jgi:uncharacterized protein GlcG (DUF336 family)
MSRHLLPRRRAAATAIVTAVMGLTAACHDSAPTGISSVQEQQGRVRQALPTHDELEAALLQARQTDNGGFNLDMWATVVDRSGVVVAVAFTGAAVGDQWQGSRVISAEKAYTANAFSLPALALSTANLYAAAQPGGTLFGLDGTNPADASAANAGDPDDWGTDADPMVGKRIGGIVVFGGGLALYAADGTLLGGLGVSGDASCADHNIAWKTRFFLALDNVPAGVSPPPAFDNIIYDISGTPADRVRASGFGHPTCSDAATTISLALPFHFPIGHTLQGP